MTAAVEGASPTYAELRRGRPPLAPLGRFFFRYRDLVFPLVFFGLVLASRPLGRTPAADRLLDVLGAVVALSGQALRVAVIGLAYIRRGGRGKQIAADGLVEEGLFAHSRNPLYLGNFLALIGFCLIYDSLACYLVGIPFFALAYLSIVVAEEEFLARRFGASYEAYRRRVNRFLPSLRGLGATLASMDFDWRRVVRKEYGSTFAGLFTMIALVTWEELARGDLGRAKETALWAAVAASLLIPLYLTAFYLKKSGALGRG